MTDAIAALAALSITNEDDLLALHRKERKELQAKVQALKKTADKKRKREVLLEIAALEAALEQRHDDQLKQLTTAVAATADNSEAPAGPNPTTDDNDDAAEPTTGNASQQQQQRVSKAQKRRDKKSIAERQLRDDIAAQEELNKTGARTVETNAINALLFARQLHLLTVPSDGDCLYNAIAQQLTQTGRGGGGGHTVASLRAIAADYIEANGATLRMYMTHPRTGDCLDDAEFAQYCTAVRSTATWGGQLEIKALSSALRVPIEVLQAAGPPTVQNDGDFGGAPLVLTYHRHMYSLGEHYNATRAAGRGAEPAEAASSSDEGPASK